MQITSGTTPLVLTDPQDDDLTPAGATWDLERTMHEIGMFDRPLRVEDVLARVGA